MNSFRDIRVFITGAGAPGAPGIIKSLRAVTERKIVILGGDANLRHAVGAGLLDKSFRILFAESPDYVDTLLEICSVEKVDVIIPLVTRELLVFATNKRRFSEKGIAVSVSDEGPLLTANNKYFLMKYCRENNYNIANVSW